MTRRRESRGTPVQRPSLAVPVIFAYRKRGLKSLGCSVFVIMSMLCLSSEREGGKGKVGKESWKRAAVNSQKVPVHRGCGRSGPVQVAADAEAHS